MIQLPTKPTVVSYTGNKAIFEIYPLYPGYGTTVGNSLRRVLISSIEGAAITSVKISGVDHEFSTIKGVAEDVIDIIVNLKKVRLKLFSDEPVTLTLESKGQGVITAADIKATSDVEIVNPEQEIATITDKKCDVQIEIRVEKGVGYVPVEFRQKEKLGVGAIAVDAIFSPVKSVNYNVENIRVGNRTDYNKVLLEIETDGTVTPHEALKRASKILMDYFSAVNELDVPETKEKAKAKKEPKTKKAKK